LPAGTSLNTTSGAITVSDASLLTAGTTSFDVTTTDEDGGVTAQPVFITFIADNEAIYAVIPAKNVDSYTDNEVLATVADIDGAITGASVTTGSLPAGASLNTSTGTIAVSDASQLTAGTTSFDVTTTDEDGGVTTQSVSIIFIADNEAVYTVSAAQNVDSYSSTDVLATATDTDGAISSASVSGGSLPAGTSLNTTSGAITVSDASLLTAGITSFDVTTTDEDGGITMQSVSITFIVDNEAIYTVNAARNVDSYGDNDVLATVADSDGTIVSASVTSGSLLPGASLNVTTGVITVSDASLLTAGTINISITTTDEEGGATTQPVSITFNADNEAVYAVSAAQNQDSYTNNDVLATVADADGAITGAAIASGSLPAGTALNATTGEIAVSNASQLTAGTASFDVLTTDASGGITTQTVAITITGDNEAIYSIGPSQNADSYTANDVLGTVSDTDGAITAGAITSGILPAGVALNAASGAITVSDASLLTAGTSNFDVTTTDATGGVTTQTIAITFTGDSEAQYVVNPPKNIDAYSDDDILATVTDGDGNVTNAALTNGMLPAGVVIDPVTGEISIVDAAAIQPGDYNLEISTSDEDGGSTVQAIVISFNDDSEAVYAVDDPKPVNEHSDSAILASVSDADGNIAGAVITNGQLPPGTSINAATGEITVENASLMQPGIYTLGISTTDNGGGISIHTITVEILASTLDSDGDGVLDIDEDVNMDSDPANDDTDQDGQPNYLDADDDGDGVPTATEDINNNSDPKDDDTDGDGTPNYLDQDDDGDGMPSAEEDANGNGDLTDDDCDKDGLPDYLDANLCDIVPEMGFSPNGDGNNDFWTIGGIDNYPDNAVKVYNRWGNLVYETSGYNNANISWKGESNGKLLLGSNGVPDGTYFYFINVDGEKRISGFVIIKR
jgi:gliding motility-associated-like protein